MAKRVPVAAASLPVAAATGLAPGNAESRGFLAGARPPARRCANTLPLTLLLCALLAGASLFLRRCVACPAAAGLDLPQVRELPVAPAHELCFLAAAASQ